NYHPYWAIDIKGNPGETAYAAGADTVVSAVNNQEQNCNPEKYASPDKCPDGARGNSVIIDHGGGIFSYYQHFSSVTVARGDHVDVDTAIGKVGNSGFSDKTFYHLHFERRSGSMNGRKVDPGPLRGCVGSTLKTYPKDLTPAPTVST